MTASPVNRLIDEMVQSGGLDKAVAARRKIVVARYMGRIGGIRLRLMEGASSIGLDIDDPYVWECIQCISKLHQYASIGGRDPELVTGGIKSAARCVRCGTVCETVRNEFTDVVDRYEYPGNESSIADEGSILGQLSDRARYRVLYHSIERREASLLLEVQRWFDDLMVEAERRGIKIDQPLKVL
jgi:hypothetical protein